ncbi:ogr/Delta-like zinc finger family protein [Chromobacterium amazonense]|uniref:Transcription factor zinc-finger domain-containing protein n=1 Tax=Chromobacterium amazonense TaxID=1382803 RepID=A0ABU8V3F0_9NEIS
MAGTWQGWRTGALGTGIPEGIPTTARHRNRRTNGVSNGRKKAAIMAGVRQCIRVAKPGRAIEHDAVMVRESGGAVKHAKGVCFVGFLIVLEYNSTFYFVFAHILLSEVFVKKSEYGEYLSKKLKKIGKKKIANGVRSPPAFFCRDCDEKMSIRTSRMADENHKEYFLICPDCGAQYAELDRLFDHRYVFLEDTSLSDIEKYITQRDLIENYQDMNIRIDQEYSSIDYMYSFHLQGLMNTVKNSKILEMKIDLLNQILNKK